MAKNWYGLRAFVSVAATLGVVGCADGSGGMPPDGGTPDSGHEDGGHEDGGHEDGGHESGHEDGGHEDGAVDAGDADVDVDAGTDGQVDEPCAEDMCGTCDDDPSNDCVADCSGTWGGDAVEDECGTCDDDPSNDCVQDCAGTWGGTAAPDGCGTCDDDPSNDCTEDCEGTLGGAATEDACGMCDDDPSNDCIPVCDVGETVDMCGTCDDDASNDCVQDCAGAWGGDAVEDMCGTCDDDASNDCAQDCAGDWGGAAVLDLCGRCVDGTTGANACPTLRLTPVADSSVESNSPTSNYGTDQRLEISAENYDGRKSRIFLRFDLSALPAGAVVRGVRLQAQAFQGYANGNDGNVYTQFVEDDSWGETTINWNNQPASEDAEALGSWWLWYNGTPEDKLGINEADALVPLVQREFEGDGVLSVRLHSAGYDTEYRSREYASADQRPALLVGYLPSSTTTLQVSADAYVDKSTTTNYGSSTDLQITRFGEQRIYLRFGLDAVPTGAEIVRATLRMTAYDGHAYGGNGNVYTRLVSDDTWTESEVTGANAPDSAVEALGYWWLWYDRTPEDKEGAFSTDALRDAVQAEADGDGSLSLKLESSGYNTSYRSREYGTAAQRPQLTVQYVIP